MFTLYSQLLELSWQGVVLNKCWMNDHPFVHGRGVVGGGKKRRPQVESTISFPESRWGFSFLGCKTGASGLVLLGSQVCCRASVRFGNGRTKGGKSQRLILCCASLTCTNAPFGPLLHATGLTSAQRLGPGCYWGAPANPDALSCCYVTGNRGVCWRRKVRGGSSSRRVTLARCHGDGAGQASALRVPRARAHGQGHVPPREGAERACAFGARRLHDLARAACADRRPRRAAAEVPPEKCRCAVGSILSEGEELASPELIHLYEKFGFKVFSFPAPSHVVTATFPYTTTLSIWLATRRVHPALDTYIKERKLCAHPRLEIYQQDHIHFMCPLARQGDFYVPEVKETERKFRGLPEANDAQMDGTGADTMSDTSSVSLEVSPGSRETSATTLSPGANSRRWDDGDTRSEHSYSESGASGSSFEELDLESEGPLGEPRLDPETEPLGATKWPWEPSTPEKGKE
nr:testis-expressed sequence 264 protein isoform X2 [Microcebus murinus]